MLVVVASTSRLPFAPKVLDFGIARRVEPGAASSIATHTGRAVDARLDAIELRGRVPGSTPR